MIRLQMADHRLNRTPTTFSLVFARTQLRVACACDPNHRRTFVIVTAITLIDIRLHNVNLRDLFRTRKRRRKRVTMSRVGRADDRD